MKGNRRLLQMLIFMFLSLSLMVNLSGCGDDSGGDSGGGASSGDTSWSAVSTTSAPTARYGHTAVWTGSEMVVWGGTPDGATVVNTGGKYNPTTDSWTATTTTGAPAARGIHTAVWNATGTEMIVWGGCTDSICTTPLDTGGRYNPTTNAWGTAIAVGPAARGYHTAVWTGSIMIICGGWGGVSTYFTCETANYNPSTNTWAAGAIANAPTARYAHTAVWTGTQMIVFGGSNGTNYLNTGGRYNPTTDSWSATTTTGAPTARYYHTAVYNATGTEMIVWGGYDGSNNVNSGGKYNPSTDSWSATSTTNAPSARSVHTAVWSGTEMIIWSGCSDINCSSYVNTGGRYNPTTDLWSATSTTNAPTARYIHTAVWTGTQMIVWGGKSSSSATSSLNTGGRYTP
ncbi:MAG: kelch repeat-containing protein [Nitrospirota bacterium]